MLSFLGSFHAKRPVVSTAGLLWCCLMYLYGWVAHDFLNLELRHHQKLLIQFVVIFAFFVICWCKIMCFSYNRQTIFKKKHQIDKKYFSVILSPKGWMRGRPVTRWRRWLGKNNICWKKAGKLFGHVGKMSYLCIAIERQASDWWLHGDYSSVG